MSEFLLSPVLPPHLHQGSPWAMQTDLCLAKEKCNLLTKQQGQHQKTVNKKMGLEMREIAS